MEDLAKGGHGIITVLISDKGDVHWAGETCGRAVDRQSSEALLCNGEMSHPVNGIYFLVSVVHRILFYRMAVQNLDEARLHFDEYIVN